MRNKSLLLCLALAGALAAVSCKPEPSKGDENGGNGGEQGEITYPFSVNEKISGTFKAGVHDGDGLGVAVRRRHADDALAGERVPAGVLLAANLLHRL